MQKAERLDELHHSMRFSIRTAYFRVVRTFKLVESIYRKDH